MNPEQGQRDRLVVIGWIVGTHGVRGEVRVKPCNGSPDRFSGISRVFLGPEDPGAELGPAVTVGGEGCRAVTLESARPHRGMALLKVEGVVDVDAALALRGMCLYLPASELPRLHEGELYSFELVGMTCESELGERLGVVVEVVEMPAGDVLRVKPDDGPDFLVPAVGDIVRQVDLLRGRLVIDDRPGLR